MGGEGHLAHQQEVLGGGGETESTLSASHSGISDNSQETNNILNPPGGGNMGAHAIPDEVDAATNSTSEVSLPSDATDDINAPGGNIIVNPGIPQHLVHLPLAFAHDAPEESDDEEVEEHGFINNGVPGEPDAEAQEIEEEPVGMNHQPPLAAAHAIVEDDLEVEDLE